MVLQRYVSKSSGYAFVKINGKWVTEHTVHRWATYRKKFW